MYISLMDQCTIIKKYVYQMDRIQMTQLKASQRILNPTTWKVKGNVVFTAHQNCKQLKIN